METPTNKVETLAISNLLQGCQVIKLTTTNISDFLFVHPVQMIEWLHKGSSSMGYYWKTFTRNILKCW
jgi:hypothetical protein